LNVHTKESQWNVPTAPAADNQKQQARCSHLLVKHRESRRPSSWREPNITKTKEEALQILQCFQFFFYFCFNFFIFI
jgi:peptidyl-prolyl cis-trans isomerase NIMA-interacting 1